jgi:hypothetical protein
MAEYLITDAEWQKYRDIIDGIHTDFNQDTLLWRRYPKSIPRYFEYAKGTPVDVSLQVLIQYNWFRGWPITRRTEEGEMDEQNMVVLINIKYLSDNGYLNSNGYFDLDADKDRFIHNGYEYKCEGDTLVAQAKDTPLLIQLILKRKTRATSVNTGEQS